MSLSRLLTASASQPVAVATNLISARINLVASGRELHGDAAAVVSLAVSACSVHHMHASTHANACPSFSQQRTATYATVEETATIQAWSDTTVRQHQLSLSGRDCKWVTISQFLPSSSVFLTHYNVSPFSSYPTGAKSPFYLLCATCSRPSVWYLSSVDIAIFDYIHERLSSTVAVVLLPMWCRHKRCRMVLSQSGLVCMLQRTSPRLSKARGIMRLYHNMANIISTHLFESRLTLLWKAAAKTSEQRYCHAQNTFHFGVTSVIYISLLWLPSMQVPDALNWNTTPHSTWITTHIWMV